jgi:hypothetical protein
VADEAGEGLAGPRLENNDALRQWLITLPRDAAVLIGARAALRVLPIAVGKAPTAREPDEWRRFAVLSATLFRAIAVTRVSGKYPIRASELFTPVVPYKPPVAANAGHVAAGYMSAYNSAAAACNATRVGVYAAAAAAAAQAIGAEILAPYAGYAVTAPVTVWSAIDCDAAALDSGSSIIELAESPLWPADSSPEWVPEYWKRVRAALPEGEDWDVWIDWYEARLEGGPAREEEELIYATVPLEKWEEGPAAANAWIKAELEKLRGREPAKIPPRLPAAIEPIVSDGRISLPATPADAELEKESLQAALEALRTQIGELAADLDGEVNIDRRVVAFLRRLSEKIPSSQPRQAELFMLAHEQEKLEAYGKIVAEEWPEFLAAGYLVVTRAFDRTVRQFPKWREFKQNAAKDRLTPEQRAEAPRMTAVFAAAFRAEDTPEFVAPEIAATLEEMWRDLDSSRDAAREDRMPAGGDTTAEDAITSIENVVKLIAEIALDGAESVGKATNEAGKRYFEKLGKGVIEQAEKEGDKDGAALVKWAKRVLIAAATDYGAKVFGVGGVLKELAEKYPHIGEWLGPVIRHLSH